MTTLTDFLLARIAEDEAIARAAIELSGHWKPAAVSGLTGPAVQHEQVLDTSGEDEWLVVSHDVTDVLEELGDYDNSRRDQFNHIVRHDPARALAECEAKRWIVKDPPPARKRDRFGWYLTKKEVLRALASVYSDHPDYRDEEWKFIPNVWVPSSEWRL